MTVYTIMLPDYEVGEEPRSIIWDDVKGTVEGEHSEIGWIRETLARQTPFDFGADEGTLTLEDPAHDPADFLHVLGRIDLSALASEILAAFNPPLPDGVEPRPIKPSPDAVFDKDGRNLGPAIYDDDGNFVEIGLY